MSRILLLLTALCLPVVGFAQSAAPAESPITTLRVTSRQVYLDVVVRDAAGQPVRGLTKDDFQIQEDGHAQQADFSRHTLATGSGLPQLRHRMMAIGSPTFPRMDRIPVRSIFCCLIC